METERINDDSLYAAFLAGDTSNYDRLMIKYGDSLTMYLKGYLYSWEDAEDLMIEAFARIMVKKPKIAEGNFKAYLFTTAHNLIYHFYKKDRRRKVFSLESLSEIPGSPAGSPGSVKLSEIPGVPVTAGIPGSEPYDAGPYEKLWNNEKKLILHKCLERIDEEMREALWLHYSDGMTYDQVASVMGLSRRRIEYLLSNGKAMLKEELGKEGITDAY